MRWAAVLTLVLLATGCISSTERFRRVVIDGTVTVDSGSGDEDGGAVVLEAHHAWRYQGELRFPMARIQAVRVDGLGEFEVVVDVPTDVGGEGLVLTGWLDRDGDGVLCGLGGDDAEPAGGVIIEDWPTYAATVDLLLDRPCAGPETLGTGAPPE